MVVAWDGDGECRGVDGMEAVVMVGGQCSGAVATIYEGEGGERQTWPGAPIYPVQCVMHLTVSNILSE